MMMMFFFWAVRRCRCALRNKTKSWSRASTRKFGSRVDAQGFQADPTPPNRRDSRVRPPRQNPNAVGPDASSRSSAFFRWFVALVQVVKQLYKLLGAALIQLADLREHFLDPLLTLTMSRGAGFGFRRGAEFRNPSRPSSASRFPDCCRDGAGSAICSGT